MDRKTQASMIRNNANRARHRVGGNQWSGYRLRIADLEAQVARLQDAFIGIAEDHGTADAFAAEYGLHPGDLDPIGGDDDGN